MANQMRAVFVSHGGGPLPLLGHEGHKEMVEQLGTIASTIDRPEAILVISAHWEEPVPTVTSGKCPPLVYDYYGFPEASYKIQYPCRGEPALANEVSGLLHDAGIATVMDDHRGFDHGVFVPLKIMYPEADIPCVELSLVNTLDASLHIDIGRALQSLFDSNVLILGSGFSFHNMSAFFKPDSDDSYRENLAFENWLEDTCTSSDYTETERERRLVRWSEAPGARYCHPREEHLLPLHVCYGVAQSPCRQGLRLQVLNKLSSMYLW